jgi:hypothetical protein
VLSREPETIRCKPVKVPRRLAGLYILPRGLEQLVFGKSHKNWIQSARLQPGVPADVISISPVLWSFQKSVENL